MRIGELADRLGVSVRTLRHYESIGLLLPTSVDPATGYRGYGSSALLRGLRIEQLKAAGLGLADVAAVLDDPAAGAAILRRRRDEIGTALRQHRRQADAVGALLDGPPITPPVLVTVPDVAVVSSTVAVPADALTRGVRREVQRMRRRLGRHGDWTFAARFPLDPVGVVDVDVAADGPALTAPTVTWPGGRALRVEVVGPPELLALAHDAARAVARAEGLALSGTVRETYRALGSSLRATVDVALAEA